MHVQLTAAGIIAFMLTALAQSPTAPRLNIAAGDRFRPLTYDELTPAQKTMAEHLLAGERRGVTGPFNVLMRSPEMGDLAQQFGAQTRYHSSLPKRLNEFAILMTARHWSVEYEWYAHKPIAIEAGLSPAILDAVAAGKRPASMPPAEDAVYAFCDELLTTKQVSDATLQKAIKAFGERGVVDLIGVSGYYGLVSMVLKVDRIPLPAGAKPALASRPR